LYRRGARSLPRGAKGKGKSLSQLAERNFATIIVNQPAAGIHGTAWIKKKKKEKKKKKKEKKKKKNRIRGQGAQTRP